MTHWIVFWLAEVAEKKGGLFDFNATLPLMAVQFLLLVVALNVLFYKPLSKALDDRAEYIRSQQAEAKAKLSKAKELAQQYEQELVAVRRKSQEVIAAAQAEAQKIVAEQTQKAQQDVQQQREAVAKELEAQKAAAFGSLEGQVEALSHQILEKLLGPELARF